ncbi:LysR family transcriptional regulator [Franconibacter helveticus]|uniref:LysR family transcriptional regulator n=1 Tax=Franconibacter helveticus TaxID=357240 RepID=UPI0019551666|nr:LysR family transcriptional regulator [Franconibacter helveticus]
MRTNQYMGLLPYMAVFVKVVETGSFSAAAEQLGTTASSISRQVASLEQALSVKLLERTTRRLKLSAAGADAYARCCEMVQSAKLVLELAERVNEAPQGIVKISAPRAFGMRLIAPHIEEFLNRYPEVDVQLKLTDRQVDLIGDDIDLMVRITDNPPDGLAARPLIRVSHIICATAAYLEKRGYPQHPNDLALHSCLYLGEVSGDNCWKFRHLQTQERVNVTVRGRYVTNHSRARLEGVLSSLGIGCLPWFVAREALEAQQVVEVLPQWDYMTSYYGMSWILYHPNRFLPPKCRVLIDFLAEKIADSDLNRRARRA